jgi:hypothetical protein
MNYLFLADVIAIVHIGYVVFVVLGFILIVAGIVFHWNWVRNPWFRIAHLTAILAVAMEAMLGIHCPLTVLELRLRRHSLVPHERISFIGTFIHSILFYEAPQWLFTLVYAIFAIIVALTFIMAPPKRKGGPPKELR